MVIIEGGQFPMGGGSRARFGQGTSLFWARFLTGRQFSGI
jgi:hypothetical protein